MTAATRPPRDSRLTGVIALVAGLLLIASAVSFARSDQSLRVAEDAAIVRDAERARASSAIYRANLAIAVVAAAAEGPSVSLQAADAAGRALDSLDSAANTLADPGPIDLTFRLQAVHAEVVDALAAGDVATADDAVSDEILPLLDALHDELAQLSATAAARIEAEGAAAGQATRASSFIVALIAPALGLWAVRRAASRRLEREKMASELARQRDIAAVQDGLISGLSHQLRTPLTGIYGFAEAMLDDIDAGPPDPLLVREGSRTILSEANRLRGMVDDILVAGRSQSGPLAFDARPFEVRAEVEAAVEPFRRVGADIEVACADIIVIGDRLRLRHVLRNLVDNALRHGRGPVRIVGSIDDSFRLAVEDAGDGPPAGTPLFQLFTHSGDDALVTGSLGLGLGVCRIICDGMGVDLEYERTADVTRFRLTWESGAVPDPAEHVQRVGVELSA